MSCFEKYFYVHIGNKLRKYRLDNNLTQEELAELLGLNLKYIGHIERQERKISLKVLLKIIQFFKIQPEDFFKFDNKYNWK